MQPNGNLTTLAERLRARTEQDAQEMENLTRQQFESLSRSLAASSKTALSTTESTILKNITDMEQNINSRCQSLGTMFGRKYMYAILLSAGILALTVLSAWGLITLYRYQIMDLQREIAALKMQKEIWDRDFPPIQKAFSGLELYRAEGKNYLLLPQGRTIRMAGTVDKQEAWEIVRR